MFDDRISLVADTKSDTEKLKAYQLGYGEVSKWS